ncbi:MAG: HAD hydrolase-like protein [Atopobiaceae bacterium]|nr:HAD hydrolase-like protein [Atopobiaceae bacterium]
MTDNLDLAGRPVVIFDFDGTVADTKASIISTATTVLRAWGIPEEDLVRVDQIIGPPFPQAFEEVFGLSHDDAVEVTRRYRDIYNYLGVESWPAFLGMTDLLDHLRMAGKRLAIASSKRRYLVKKGLEDNGIDGLFDSVCAKRHDGMETKADCIRQAMSDLGAGVADAVMVGDRHHDVDAAGECGIPCVGVLYGQTADRRELEEAGAAAIANTVADLESLLLE